jgi:hypothetical protein
MALSFCFQAKMPFELLNLRPASCGVKRRKQSTPVRHKSHSQRGCAAGNLQEVRKAPAKHSIRLPYIYARSFKDKSVLQPVTVLSSRQRCRELHVPHFGQQPRWQRLLNPCKLARELTDETSHAFLRPSPAYVDRHCASTSKGFAKLID